MQINWIESPLMIIENSQIEHGFWMIKWSEINQNSLWLIQGPWDWIYSSHISGYIAHYNAFKNVNI